MREDDGMVTLETAVGISSLLIVLILGIGALATIAQYMAAVDIAGAAARAHAIGVEYTPPRGQVQITTEGGIATAHAQIPMPLHQVSASAYFPAEDAQ